MKKFTQDRHFYWFLTLGPVVWVGLSLFIDLKFNVEKPLQQPWAFLSMVLVFPVLEELVFRGLIQEKITEYSRRRRLGPVSSANLITSLLFVAAHLLYQPVIWALLVFFPSLAFGYVKERYASLWPPISLHVFYNLGFFMLFAQ